MNSVRFRNWRNRCDEARSVPILEIVERLNLGEPTGSGSHYLIRCPFHDDRRPSFYIEPTKGVWKCFPCDAGGDGIRLVERALGLRFVDAVHWLVGNA